MLTFTFPHKHRHLLSIQCKVYPPPVYGVWFMWVFWRDTELQGSKSWTCLRRKDVRWWRPELWGANSHVMNRHAWVWKDLTSGELITFPILSQLMPACLQEHIQSLRLNLTHDFEACKMLVWRACQCVLLFLPTLLTSCCLTVFERWSFLHCQ